MSTRTATMFQIQSIVFVCLVTMCLTSVPLVSGNRETTSSRGSNIARVISQGVTTSNGVAKGSKYYQAFSEIASRLGMHPLGTADDWLKENPNAKGAIEKKLAELCAPNKCPNEIDSSWLYGEGMLSIPIPSTRSGFTDVLFLETKSFQLVHRLPWYGVICFPEAWRLLHEKIKDHAILANLLLPRYVPHKESYNSQMLPARYRTSDGSVEFTYSGDDKRGEIQFKLFQLRPVGALEELIYTASFGIEIGVEKP
jgi:hypothetical protein